MAIPSLQACCMERSEILASAKDGPRIRAVGPELSSADWGTGDNLFWDSDKEQRVENR